MLSLVSLYHLISRSDRYLRVQEHSSQRMCHSTKSSFSSFVNQIMPSLGISGSIGELMKPRQLSQRKTVRYISLCVTLSLLSISCSRYCTLTSVISQFELSPEMADPPDNALGGKREKTLEVAGGSAACFLCKREAIARTISHREGKNPASHSKVVE